MSALLSPFSNHWAFTFAHFRFFFQNREQRHCRVDRSSPEDDKTADSHINIYCVCQLQFNDLLLHFRAIFPQWGEYKKPTSEGANDVFRCNKNSELWVPNNDTLECCFKSKPSSFSAYILYTTHLCLWFRYTATCVFLLRKTPGWKATISC